MCAGALVNARIARLVFGASDPKAGAVVSLFQIGVDPRLNHRFEVEAGFMAEEGSRRLSRFFADLRAKRAASPP
jgi:tRNA(adenine34) deaminase